MNYIDFKQWQHYSMLHQTQPEDAGFINLVIPYFNCPSDKMTFIFNAVVSAQHKAVLRFAFFLTFTRVFHHIFLTPQKITQILMSTHLL